MTDRTHATDRLLDRLPEPVRRVVVRCCTRRTMLAGLALAVPIAALAQPLGLLLWARIRLLTSIPRTAMAIEEETMVAAEPVAPAFPDLPDNALPAPGLRDPFATSSRHFPNSTIRQGLSESTPKSATGRADDEGRAASVVRDRLAGIVGRLRVQGLVPGRGVALIDGRVRRVGDSFPAGLEGSMVRLVAVEQSKVVVECGDLEFDIRLDGGGTGSVVIRPQGEELSQP